LGKIESSIKQQEFRRAGVIPHIRSGILGSAAQVHGKRRLGELWLLKVNDRSLGELGLLYKVPIDV
jgi:hypothetical protein